MKKIIFRRLIALCLISFFVGMGRAAVDTVFSTAAEPYKQSMVIDFEDPDNFVDGTDITQGYGTYTAGITDNMLAMDFWDDMDAPVDPINQSAYCLEVNVAGVDSLEGPNLVFTHPVTISALDSSTWFFHIQMVLPEFQVKGGIFAMNMFDAPNMGARGYIYDSNATTGQIRYPTDYNANDRPRQCWVELDYDMRPFFGVTFYSIQIQGERGTGAATWYCDNICFDNRQKAFKSYELGTEVPLTVADDGTQYLIFYAVTSYCMTAQPNPPVGYAQTAFSKFDPEMYTANSETNFQVWNVKKSSIAADKQYYTIDYDYGYLYNDGSLRSKDETDGKFSWFLTQKEGDAGLRLLNSASWKYIAPSEKMEDLELGASSDSTAQWVFIPNNKAAIDAYLLTTSAGDSTISNRIAGVDNTEMEGLSVYAEKNILYIRASKSEEIPLYSVDGRIIRRLSVHEGINSFILEKGVYIVKGMKVVIH